MSRIGSGKLREKAVAFVVVRLSSSRLPAKQLRRIGDRQLLEWTIKSLSQSKELDEIVITTVAEPENEPLRAFAEANSLPLFWYDGAVDHVTTRLARAAEARSADICLLISGDCPLLDVGSLDQMVAALRSEPEADLVHVLPDEHGVAPILEGISSVARARAWQLGDELSDQPELKEHQFPVFGIHPDRFESVNLRLPRAVYAPHHRYSVDTRADLEFMNTVHDELARNHRPFNFGEAMSLVQEQPELLEINAHVHQRKLDDRPENVLFIVDAGGRYGFGHLMRCRELATQLVERLGWSAEFMVDDPEVEAGLREEGFRVRSGAFARPSRTDKSANNPEELVWGTTFLIIDVHPSTVPAPGWRAEWAGPRPTVVIDQLDGWTDEADLIIIPGVTASAEQLAKRRDVAPPVLSGKEMVILRDEIRRARRVPTKKDIDVLVYLQEDSKRCRVGEFLQRHGLTFHILAGFDSEFPSLLKRSRVFLSGFGYTFYEALALGTYPVAWPHSEGHKRDAERFFGRLDLAPAIVCLPEDLDQAIRPMLDFPRDRGATLFDGSPNIVERLQSLRNERLSSQTRNIL